VCFIDIAEENIYKTMILEDHRQEKIKEIENRLARLDWDINTGYLSTKTHRPVGVGHQHNQNTTHKNDVKGDKCKTIAPTQQLHSCFYRNRKSSPPLKGERRGKHQHTDQRTGPFGLQD
jgi:hypothetical protein